MPLVEAAYLVDAPYGTWALGLLKSAEAIVEGGIGGFACAFEVSRKGGLSIAKETGICLGVPENMVATVLAGLTSAPPEWFRRAVQSLRRPAECVLTSEFDPNRKLTYRSRLATAGVDDGINILARDLNDRGFLISLGIARNRTISGALRNDLRKASTHVLAALRLRSRLGMGAPDGGPNPSDPEAVLSPQGRVVHAQGEATLTTARRKLEAAVSDIERARADRFDDPRRALQSWKGLVAARWSLIDSYERGGKRYVVARENVPRPAGIAGLTPTESNVVAYIARGSSTKETAYALGISDATVRVLVMRAARRCGVKSRRDLLDAWTRVAGTIPSGGG